jgi:hypothetical protein
MKYVSHELSFVPRIIFEVGAKLHLRLRTTQCTRAATAYGAVYSYSEVQSWIVGLETDCRECGFSWFASVPGKHCLKICTGRFFSHPFQFIISELVCYSTVNNQCDWKCVSKYTKIQSINQTELSASIHVRPSQNCRVNGATWEILHYVYWGTNMRLSISSRVVASFSIFFKWYVVSYLRIRTTGS